MFYSNEILLKLKNASVFDHLSELHKYNIIKLGQFQQVQKNHYLFHQGEMAEVAWLLIEGVIERIKYLVRPAKIRCREGLGAKNVKNRNGKQGGTHPVPAHVK